MSDSQDLPIIKTPGIALTTYLKSIKQYLKHYIIFTHENHKILDVQLQKRVIITSNGNIKYSSKDWISAKGIWTLFQKFLLFDSNGDVYKFLEAKIAKQKTPLQQIYPHSYDDRIKTLKTSLENMDD